MSSFERFGRDRTFRKWFSQGNWKKEIKGCIVHNLVDTKERATPWDILSVLQSLSGKPQGDALTSGKASANLPIGIRTYFFDTLGTQYWNKQVGNKT